LQKAIPYRQADIVMRPYGIDLVPVFQRKYSRPNQPLQLVYAGRIIEHQKRVSDLLRLAEILAHRGVDFHLRVIGNGPEKSHLLQRVRSLPPNLHTRISIEPMVPHSKMPAILQSADAAVMVSAFEGTSLFMLEAMASGTVPVVTAVSGTAPLVEPGRTGYRVPVGHLEEMADCLSLLAGDRTKLAAMGRAARERAENYAQESYNQWFFGILDEVWDEAPRKWPKGRRLVPLSREFPSRLFDYFPGSFAGLKKMRNEINRRLGV
jgi:glycosyltransferase involved in cell wall biosynthesis